MGLFGVAPAISIFPGQRGLMFGSHGMPTGPTALQTVQPDVAGAGAISRPVVIASVPSGIPTSQRQIIWRVFGTGSLNISLLASVDGIEGNFVVISNYTGTGNSGPLIVQSDNGSGPATTVLAVGAFRYFACENTGALSVSLYSDITAE